MQKAYIIFFLVIYHIIGFDLYAQHTIRGIVQDSLGKSIKSVNIRLIANKDTSSVFTNARGEFGFSNVKGSYIILTYSMLGYKTESSSHYIIEGKRHLQLPPKILKSFHNIIPSVSVIHVVPMLVMGDTTQFNFGAFEFRKNSLLEDALRTLPGFQVYRDGSVTYNGRQISRVRVDNRDFFGGDLLTATRNLPVDFIKNIQLINAKRVDENDTGFLADDTEKVLNINLKKDKKRIYFGQGTLGLGSNDRYLGSFGINKFNEGQEISVLGSFNNTNTNLFSFGSPGGGHREKNLMEMGSYADPIDGLNKIGSLGFNFSDKLSDNINANVSYTYLYQNNSLEGNSQLTSTYIGNTIFRKDDYKINTTDRIHRIRFGFDMNFKNKDFLKINGILSYNDQESYHNKDLLLKNKTVNSEGNYQDSSRNSSPNADIDFLYSKYFKKKGRKLIGNLSLNTNVNNRSNFVKEAYLESIPNTVTENNILINQDQLVLQKNQTGASKASLQYVEPFSEYSLLEIAYEYEVTSINAIRQVEDRLLLTDYKFIDSLSVDYEYLFTSHKGSMLYQYEPNKKFKVNFGFAVQPLVMRGYLPLYGTDYIYDNVNLIPTANLLYKFSKEMDWQFNYKGKNIQPYFNQIAPVIDNTNSKNIIIGNPNLKSEYSHRISTTFRKSRSSRMQYFETNFAYNFVLNKIVSDKRTLPSSTIQETSFLNASGYYDWKWYYILNTPIITNDLQLEVSGTSDYYNNKSFVDGRERVTNQFVANQSIQLKYTWNDYFESILNSNYLWNQARYDIPYRTKIDIKTMNMGLGVKGYLNDNLSIGLEMSQRYNDGYNNSILNTNQTLMNSFIDFTFLRNKSALIRFQAYDLFDQNKNSGIISEYIGNDVYEARNNRLGRYFMLSLNIRFQKLPNTK